MKTNKKTILIGWFIGVGCGLFFSGMILSILVFTSNKAELKPTENQEQVQGLQGEEPEKPADVPESLQVDKELEPEIIELEIETSATAREITQMLVDNGVISDYDEFIAYIVSMDAERSLSHGKKTFPLNSDIETIFKILAPYK